MDLSLPLASNHLLRVLGRPSRRFRLQAWSASVGLALFLAFYFGLTGWFGWIAWESLQRFLSGSGGWMIPVLGLPAIFLVAVMVKGLFFVRRGSTEGLVECREEDQPELFQFIRSIVADVGAPRPHRVFLSARVNASVFYDIALWNLLVPSRRNLEIGLGLVQALSLGEFKAVIAHEFGHFAQRTMTVGRWVHVARQFVGDLVMRRDALDRFLNGLSRSDLRIAWIGWGLRLIVWSIRSVLDTAFGAVVALERALSRQMEFQADLVSVAVSGSDSLVHALLKIGVADDIWEKAMFFSIGEMRCGRPVADLFAVQARILEQMRVILGDRTHGIPPPVPTENPEMHRVFRSALGDAPRMWASHPPNHEREGNIKSLYIASVPDDRPAWVLFRDADRLRTDMTRRVLEANAEPGLPGAVPIEDSLLRLDQEFSRPHLDRRFRGAYLGLPVTRDADRVSDLYEARDEAIPATVREELASLYPPSLALDLEHLRELGELKVTLEGLRQGFLAAPAGVIRFRGRAMRRQDLPVLIRQVDAEWTSAHGRILAHDRTVRTVHRQAGRLVGRGWEGHLVGLAALLHYAEHTAARLEDAHGYLGHIFALAAADRRITRKEIERLQETGSGVRAIVEEIHRQRHEVGLPAAIVSPAGASWADWIHDRPDLPPPTLEDIAQGWLGALANRVQVYSAALGSLRSRSLDALVEAEAHVARCLQAGEDPGAAPEPARVPASYPHFREGAERPRRERLGWWERFQIAAGPIAAGARLSVAAAVLVPALALSWTAGSSTIAVHNGLGIPVVVRIDGSALTVGPHETVRASHQLGRAPVRTSAHENREIERFEAEIPRSGTLVYNVAGASALVEWTVTYGNAVGRPPRSLGTGRWLETDADLVFEKPPESLSTRSGGAVRRVVLALDDESPFRQVMVLQADEDRRAIALAHSRWDPIDHPDLPVWMEFLAGQPDSEGVLRSRLADPGINVAQRRLQMDQATPEERTELCAGYARSVSQRPDVADLAYLSARCMPDGPEQDAAFLEAARRFPASIWLRWAAATSLIGREDFSEGLVMLEPLLSSPEVRRTTLGPGVASSLVRLRRLLGTGMAEAEVEAADLWIPSLKDWLEVEQWRRPPQTATSYLVATWHLVQGNLSRVLATPGLSDAEREALTLRVALSEGATPEQVEAGLRLPPDRLDGWLLVWPAAALAIREGRDTSPIREAFASRPPFNGPVWEALEPGRLRSDPGILDAAVKGLSLELRGSARISGIVLLGAAAPEAWRREARSLLLPHERPYLR